MTARIGRLFTVFSNSRNRRRFIISGGLLLAVGLIVADEMISFWKSPTPGVQAVMGKDVAPGSVLIDILEGGRPEHYWQYQVQPSSGTVLNVMSTQFRDYSDEKIPHVYQEPAGAGGCKEHPLSAYSPDGRFVAECKSDFRWKTDDFKIKDRTTSRTLYSWKTDEWREVRGFAWSPNSHSIAVLNTSEYYGKSPVELLSAMSGHPIPHNTVFLDVIDLQKESKTEYLMQGNVVSAFCRILAWAD